MTRPENAASDPLTEEGGVNESSSGVHGQQMSPLRSPENDRSGRSFASTSPPAASGSDPQIAAKRRDTVRPRFTVEDVRILLAAMHLYAIREQTEDVLDLLARVDALSAEIEGHRV